MNTKELNQLSEYRLRHHNIDYFTLVFHIYSVGLFFTVLLLDFISLYELIFIFGLLMFYHIAVGLSFHYKNIKLRREVLNKKWQAKGN